MSSSFKVVNGDVVINASSGRPSIISDGAKVRQDINEFFTVNIQQNGFGAGLDQLVGVVQDSSAMFISLASKQISDGFTVFQSLQVGEPRIPRTTAEKLASLAYLNVDVDTTDPTTFYFTANILTESGIPLSISTPFSTGQ